MIKNNSMKKCGSLMVEHQTLSPGFEPARMPCHVLEQDTSTD